LLAPVTNATFPANVTSMTFPFRFSRIGGI
jgi:hypothetical protein